jgi:hypothetical protein
LIVPAPMKSICDNVIYYFLLWWIIKKSESTIILIFIIVVGVFEFVVNVIIALLLSESFLLIDVPYPSFPLINIDFQTDSEFIIILSLCSIPIRLYYNIEFLFYYWIVDYINFIGFYSSIPLSEPDIEFWLMK